MFIDIKVRPVTRYVITEFHRGEPNEHGICEAGSCTLGEFDHADYADRVAHAVFEQHQRKAGEDDDVNVTYSNPSRTWHQDPTRGDARSELTDEDKRRLDALAAE